ncbi:hypothetical protein C483_15801 [Natrialba hulunbeirensis JCM 10989]|uniref:DUF7511 domain-containing protein n=1 Tax=Natrialba hulunbeirensis JCM 10989 TaxID=1227493 RepID=L9ZQ34_9EURY|nr:hypothetical protein [Natrialba hulunbeirensis]ELY88191.1 hypothetical protein C483_15801 [Natrialba hulunbeirensis JCM 10989]
MTNSHRERNGERITDTDTEPGTDSASKSTSTTNPRLNPEHDESHNRQRSNARVLTGSPPSAASTAHTSSTDDALESNPSAALERIVVQYEDEPNRWTLVPQERTADERLTAWLSADEDVFIDRSAMR